MGEDVPDDYEQTSTKEWRESVGLRNLKTANDDDKDGTTNTAVMVVPSPAFQKQKSLDDLLRGLELHVSPTIFGAIASTVSSLSRARLFRYDAQQGDSCIQTLADGCVGVVLTGDIQVKMMIAQGAKPVGGVYQIVKGQETTISAIALDEPATELVQTMEEEAVEDDDDDDDQEGSGTMDKKAQMAQAYAKARIPKPVLAEANFLMKNLSDDDEEFMRKALLVGLERSGALGRTSSELVRLAEGKGHSFTVHQVASASMKDGSVTLPLGSVDIQPGQRLRFYVRESPYAKKEIEALWTGYKRRVLTQNIKSKEDETTIKPPFTPTGGFLFPTLDRGNKFFVGKTGHESQTVLEYLPTLPSLSGFFSNGVIGSLDADPEVGTRQPTSLYVSASGYILLGSSKYYYIHDRLINSGHNEFVPYTFDLFCRLLTHRIRTADLCAWQGRCESSQGARRKGLPRGRRKAPSR
jgi:small ligand-binding sensory domain FIST